MTDHHRLLGLGVARSRWPRDIARWATSAALPIDFASCLTVEELRSRLTEPEGFAVVLVEASHPALGRTLARDVRSAGAELVVVCPAGPTPPAAASAPDVAALLREPLTIADVSSTLRRLSRPASATTSLGADPGRSPGGGPHRREVATDPRQGLLVAVFGCRGSGATTEAVALAQGLAKMRPADSVVLADLALQAEQALVHDVGDVVPGLQELVECHSGAQPGRDVIRSLTFWLEERRYHLLVGLRRRRDWAALPGGATDAALAGLAASFDIVVAEVEGDLEGLDECGSLEVEERNHLARQTCRSADVVVVVSQATTVGAHRAVLAVDELVRCGVEGAAVLVVLEGAARSWRLRAQISSALSELLAELPSRPSDLASPLFLPQRKRLDELVAAGTALPDSWCEPLARAVLAWPPRRAASVAARVLPGSLGLARATGPEA